MQKSLLSKVLIGTLVASVSVLAVAKAPKKVASAEDDISATVYNDSSVNTRILTKAYKSYEDGDLVAFGSGVIAGWSDDFFGRTEFKLTGEEGLSLVFMLDSYEGGVTPIDIPGSGSGDYTICGAFSDATALLKSGDYGYDFYCGDIAKSKKGKQKNVAAYYKKMQKSKPAKKNKR